MRFEVHVAKRHDAFDGLFENLRAPAGLRAGIVTLAALEAQLLQRAHEIDKVGAGTTERVVVVVRPAEAQSVLAFLLHPGGAIPAPPIGPLLPEENVAGEIPADQAQELIEEGVGSLPSLGVRPESAWTGLPKLVREEEIQNVSHLSRPVGESAIATALDRFKPRSIFLRSEHASEARERFAVNLPGDSVCRHEVRDAVNPNGEP